MQHPKALTEQRVRWRVRKLWVLVAHDFRNLAKGQCGQILEKPVYSS